MARKRIELPSADELFGDAGPARPARATKPKKAAPKKPTTAARSTSAAAKTSAKKATPKKTPAKQPATRQATKTRATAKKPATKKPAPPARRAATRRAPAPPAAPARNGHGASPELRLSALESRLGAMPVDALIDLRDGLEELLAADVVDEAAVRGLLDSLGA